MTEEQHRKAGQVVVDILEDAPKMHLNVSLSRRNDQDIDIQGHIGFDFSIDGIKELTKQTVLRRLLESLGDAQVLIKTSIEEIKEIVGE